MGTISTSKRHMTWQEVVTTRCDTASKWAMRASKTDPVSNPTDLRIAIRIAIEDLEVAERRLLTAMQSMPSEK